MKETKLGRIIRKAALVFGIALLGVSIFMSYDGFDGSVNGNNGYAGIAVVIGYIFAITVTIIQFIFTNEYRQLNPTLIAVGLLSYAYSIYTNKLGAEHLLGMSGWMAWFTAAMSDVVAEPMISWGLGESLVGDLIGNLWKAINGDDEPKKPVQPVQPVPSRPQTSKPKYHPQHKPVHLSQKGRQDVIRSIPFRPTPKKDDDGFRKIG